MKLTDRAVEALRVEDGKAERWEFDDALKGFGVRLTAAGKRIFIFQYRNGAKVRRASLGEWGAELTTVQARRKAEALRDRISTGAIRWGTGGRRSPRR